MRTETKIFSSRARERDGVSGVAKLLDEEASPASLSTSPLSSSMLAVSMKSSPKTLSVPSEMVIVVVAGGLVLVEPLLVVGTLRTLLVGAGLLVAVDGEAEVLCREDEVVVTREEEVEIGVDRPEEEGVEEALEEEVEVREDAEEEVEVRGVGARSEEDVVVRVPVRDVEAEVVTRELEEESPEAEPGVRLVRLVGTLPLPVEGVARIFATGENVLGWI